MATLDQSGALAADHARAEGDRAARLRVTTRAQRMAESLLAADDSIGVELLKFPNEMAQAGGKIIAFWPRRADKAAGETGTLYGLIDGRTDSVITQAVQLAAAMDKAATDPNLSPVGRRAAVGAVLRERAPRIAPLARRFLLTQDKMKAAGEELAGVTAYDAKRPWEWAQDLEVARTIRELPDDQRTSLRRALELGEHVDIAESLLRVPVYLTGLPADRMGQILAAVINAKNPGYGERVKVESEALAAAASAINALAALMESGAWLDHEELRVLMGADIAEVRAFAGKPLAEARPAPPADTAA